jgi:Domain of unknown function (DUF4129)
MTTSNKSLIDFIAMALSPLLIMALVGSLVFFLIEVLAPGLDRGSLQWILFFFIFAAVLIARMTMGDIASRAGIYGLVLGLVVWLALQRFVEYPAGSSMVQWGWAINLGLMALIWWSAHRLTWDCTLLDDNADPGAAGLLETAGLQKDDADPQEATPPVPARAASEPDPSARKTKKKKKPSAQSGGLSAWWQRYCKFRAERKEKRVPGVWVVYFSLAALPLFGIGQAQIPADQVERRHYAFWLMVVYVGSGLGLLLTTAFLGLRRYLRQRGLRMPAGITAGWLTLGVMLIAVLMFAGAWLPRPAAPHPLWEWTGLSRTPSKEKARHRSDDNQDKDAKGEEAGDKDGEGKDKKDNNRGEDKDKKGPAGNNKEKGDQQGGGKGDQESDSANPLTGFMESLAPILKWIALAVFIVLIAFFLLRAGLQFLANFTDWARNLLAAWRSWWQGFLGWFKRSKSEAGAVAAAPPAPPRPYASFRDPFLTGAAAGRSPAELVHYSFAALEAWALQYDMARDPQETPFEFMERMAREVEPLAADVPRLAHIYINLAYAGREPNAEDVDALRDFWLALADAAPMIVA